MNSRAFSIRIKLEQINTIAKIEILGFDKLSKDVMIKKTLSLDDWSLKDRQLVVVLLELTRIQNTRILVWRGDSLNKATQLDANVEVVRSQQLC